VFPGFVEPLFSILRYALPCLAVNYMKYRRRVYIIRAAYLAQSPSRFCKASNPLHICARQLRIPMNADRVKQAYINRMLNVIPVTNVFKICNAVIRFIAVDMVCHQTAFSWTEESFCYKPMSLDHLLPSAIL
jgi:hypothetical protein